MERRQVELTGEERIGLSVGSLQADVACHGREAIIVAGGRLGDEIGVLGGEAAYRQARAGLVEREAVDTAPGAGQAIQSGVGIGGEYAAINSAIDELEADQQAEAPDLCEVLGVVSPRADTFGARSGAPRIRV